MYDVIGLKIMYSVFIKRVQGLGVFLPPKCDNTNLLCSDNPNFLCDNTNFLCDNPNLLCDNPNLLYDNTNLLYSDNPNFLCDNRNSLCLRLIVLLSVNRNWEIFSIIVCCTVCDFLVLLCVFLLYVFLHFLILFILISKFRSYTRP